MDTLGILEVNSIPAGIESGDSMLKAAMVELVGAQSVCAGKYIVIVTGSVSAVKSAVEAGVEKAGMSIVDSAVISSLHPQVIPAITATSEVESGQAAGIIETFSIAGAVICADVAVKSASVSLGEIRLGRGLGGKSFLTIFGSVSDVSHAVEAATSGDNIIARAAVIPSPHPDILKSII